MVDPRAVPRAASTSKLAFVSAARDLGDLGADPQPISFVRSRWQSLTVGLASGFQAADFTHAISEQAMAGSGSSAEGQPLRRLEAEMAAAPRPRLETGVVFLPRDPQWAFVHWEISAEDRQNAVVAKAEQLVLRVCDVTGLPAGSVHQHTLQELLVNAQAREWFVPVPMSDRDYQVELGYRMAGGGWLSLAVSAPARMPAAGPSQDIDDQFVPFLLDPPTNQNATIAPVTPPPSLAAGLHERLYLQASSGRQVLGRGSEAFHDLHADQASSAGNQASGIGLWASGRNDSGAGLMPRQRSFWLVADAELIVYGATDPAATLRIGEEIVPLASDGTFRLQVPFRDGQQVYPITAVAADGEQRRAITLEFSRSTPLAGGNSQDAAVAEWF